jgi:hypothetical protein
MYAVESYAAFRRFVFVEGRSRRAVNRLFGLSRETVSRTCRFSAPPGYVGEVSRAANSLKGPGSGLVHARLGAADLPELRPLDCRVELPLQPLACINSRLAACVLIWKGLVEQPIVTA